MRFEVDVRSMLVGAGLLAAIGWMVGWQETSGVTPITRVENPPIRVVGIPDPRDIILIEEGVPYVVPAERSLVLTALGAHTASSNVYLNVDGFRQVSAQAGLNDTGSAVSMKELPPPGLLVLSGSTVEPTGGTLTSARAWGYLIDAP